MSPTIFSYFLVCLYSSAVRTSDTYLAFVPVPVPHRTTINKNIQCSVFNKNLYSSTKGRSSRVVDMPR